MTFEELKFEIIDRSRKLEINKLFHLYIKAETYNDILRLLKSEGNYRWILRNGFADLLSEFPTEELELEGFYSGEVTLSDLNSDVVILPGGNLTLIQSGNKRCRVTCQSSNATITTNDLSMVEVECYDNSVVFLTSNSYSYGYITARDSSQIRLQGNNKSTFYLSGWEDSITTANISLESFLNSNLNDDSTLNIDSENYYAKQNDKSRIEIEPRL